MKRVIKTDGSFFDIDESLYPLNLYSSLVAEHIQNNDVLSDHFYSTEMKDYNTMKQELQREYGNYILPELVNGMGIRNLELASQGTVVNTVGIAQDNAGIKLLLETGALRTTVSLASQLKHKYNNHASVYDGMINEINNFLVEKGF